MKRLIIICSILPAILIVLSGCNSDKTAGLDKPYTDSKHISSAINIFADVRDDVILKMTDPDLGVVGFPLQGVERCPEVSSTSPLWTFPNKVVLDYGEECLCSSRDEKSGKIIVDQSANLKRDGAVWTFHFVDFYINGVKIEGTHTLSPLGGAESAKPSFSVNTEDLRIIWQDGRETKIASEETMVWTEGADSESPDDDIFEISGTSSGISGTGKSYTSEIIEPLVKSRACSWISKGVVKIGDGEDYITSNYGNASCDNRVQVTLPSGDDRFMRIGFDF